VCGVCGVLEEGKVEEDEVFFCIFFFFFGAMCCDRNYRVVLSCLVLS
jgi:hypothetical protein